MIFIIYSLLCYNDSHCCHLARLILVSQPHARIVVRQREAQCLEAPEQDETPSAMAGLSKIILPFKAQAYRRHGLGRIQVRFICGYEA